MIPLTPGLSPDFPWLTLLIKEVIFEIQEVNNPINQFPINQSLMSKTEEEVKQKHL